jgi:hypothetical protein
MVNKDVVHSVKIAPMATQISATDAAAINAQFATALDTQGYEGNAIVVYFADVNNVLDNNFRMYESDVSATDAGTAVTAANVRVRRHDGVLTKCPAATGILTTTAAADEDSFWIFEYIGNKRWVRVTAAAGTADVTIGMFSLQTHARHGMTA